MSSTTKKSAGALTVVLAVVGGVALLGAGGTAAYAGARAAASTHGGMQADVVGVTSVDLDAGLVDMTVEFRPDIDRAQLDIEKGTPGDWSLHRDGDELKVRGPGYDLWGFRPFWMADDQRVTLVLPQSLRGVDADLSLGAGSLTVDCDFAELDVDLDAGSLSLAGSARSLDVEVNAGRAEIDLTGVRTAEYNLNAGNVTSVLRTVPDEVQIDTAAGSMQLTLPRAEYDVRRDLAAGSLDSRLTERPGSDHTVAVSAAAGSVTLREG